MPHPFVTRISRPLLLPAALLTVALSSLLPKPASAQQCPPYSPLPIPSSGEVSDRLSEADIPTGYGGFARDYTITFAEGDHVLIELTSDEFDPIITLVAPDGTTYGENDDGPDGTTNSLLFARIMRGGEYVLRVRPYGGQGMGLFNLKVTRLRPM